MRLCDDYGLFDFRSACVRDTWGALLPFSFLLALCLFSFLVPSFPRKVHAIVKAPFQEYITLHETEALDVEVEEKDWETGSWSRNQSHFGARSCACSSVSSERSAGLRMGTKFLRTVFSPSLLPLSGYTPPYDPLPVRGLHHYIGHVHHLPPLPRLFHSATWQVTLRPHRLFHPIL